MTPRLGVESPDPVAVWYVHKVKPTRLGGYEIAERIGVGGMAEVFRAHLSRPGGAKKTVCLKRVHPHLCTDQDFIAMFIQEARTLLTLSHSNIVQAFDVGHEDGQYFLVMESLSGRDLISIQAESHRRDLPIPRELAVYIVMEVLEGLVYAHGLTDPSGQPLHIVHRDINPSNVMITDHGEVKILDFGIAKSAVRDFRTRTGIIKGKLGYMAPEQARGGTIDARTDIFACGVMLYELLTGQKPFTDDGVLQGELLITYPEESLVATLGMALAKSAEDRFGSAVEMHRSLSGTLARWGARPTSLDLADYVRALFGGDSALAGGSEQLDAFDRHLAAQVPEILVSRRSSDDAVARTQPDEASSTEPARTEVDQDATELQDPIHALETEPLDMRNEEVTAPFEKEGRRQDDLVTEPLGGVTEELPETGRSRDEGPLSERREEAALSDDEGEQGPATHDTTGEMSELIELRRRSAAWWGLIAAVLLAGVTLGVYGTLRSNDPQGQDVASVADVAGPTSSPPSKMPLEARAAVDAGSPVDSESDAGALEWVDVEPSRRVSPRAKRATSTTHLASSVREKGPEEPPERPGGVTRQEVHKTLNALRPYLRLCLSRASEPMATLSIRLSIAGNGTATFVGATPHPPAEVAFCLKRVIGQARFRATGAETITAVYPLHLPALDR